MKANSNRVIRKREVRHFFNFQYQQQSASFSIDDENEKSVRDYAELSVSDCNDSRDECGNDAVDSGADGLRPKPTEDTAADGQLCSPQVSFLQVIITAAKFYANRGRSTNHRFCSTLVVDRSTNKTLPKNGLTLKLKFVAALEV